MVYQTSFASPQLELLELDEAQWVKVHQRAWYRRPRPVRYVAEQLPLLAIVGSVVCLFPYVLTHGMGKNFFPYVSTVM